jgi:hypothetical protein
MSRTISVLIKCDECGEATLESDVLVVPFKYGKTERLLDICRPCDGMLRNDTFVTWLGARPASEPMQHVCQHEECKRAFNTKGALGIHLSRMHKEAA